MKGQGSIEILILLIVIITASTLIVNTYIQTQDATIALEITRNELNTQTKLLGDSALIKNLRLVKTDNTAKIQVTTFPKTLTEEDFNLEIVKQKIVQVTKYNEVIFEIN